MTEKPLSPIRRVYNVVRALLSAHLTVAREEARRDLTRLATGIGLLVFGLISFLHVWVLLHVLVVVAIFEAGLSLVASIGIVAGADALIGLIVALVGRKMISKPMLQESRELLQRTMEAAGV